MLGGSVSRHSEVHKYFCSWFSFSGALWMKIRQVCSFLDYQVIVRYRIRHQNWRKVEESCSCEFALAGWLCREVPSLIKSFQVLYTRRQAFRGKEEEAWDKEVLSSLSDGKKLADIVHLAGGKGIFQRCSIILWKRDRNWIFRMMSGTDWLF